LTRPRRGEPKAETKILAAGRKLFARRGFSETSVGDIARAAEVARATVYNNFDDKQDILAAIIGDYMAGYARIAQELRSSARSGQTSFELVQEMVREALAWRVQNADMQPIVAVARNLRGSGWEEANKAADDAMLGWILAVHAVDEAAGLIREDIELEFGLRGEGDRGGCAPAGAAALVLDLLRRSQQGAPQSARPRRLLGVPLCTRHSV
jgi:AcrR family transcriptional regulator